MQFSCSRQRLADVLSPINEIIPDRLAKPILHNFSISPAGDNTLLFQATDLEVGLRYRFEVENLVDAESILIPVRRFNALVQGDSSNEWKVSISGGKMEIRNGNGKLNIIGNTSDEFPPIAEMDENDQQVIFINGDDLCQAISKTVFCVARGDSRYALNGVFFRYEGNMAEFVASDTHRLSRVVCKVRNPENLSGQGIIIPRGMNILSKLAAGHESVALKFTGKELIVRTRNASLVIRLVDGQFPRYREVIPEKAENTVTVDREEWSRILRLAGCLSNEETRVVKIAVGDGKMLVNAEGGDTGDARQELTAETSGEFPELSFNFLFLIEMLKALGEEKIVLRIKDADTPLRVDSGDFTHIVMPLRRY